MAGQVALRQLRLSWMRDDPNLIIRCLIYEVYSYCQRGQKRKAVTMIRKSIYPSIVIMISRKKCQDIVINMYRAACHKIRYMTPTAKMNKKG